MKLQKNTHTPKNSYNWVSRPTSAILHMPGHQVWAEPVLPRQFLESDLSSSAYSTAVQSGEEEHLRPLDIITPMLLELQRVDIAERKKQTGETYLHPGLSSAQQQRWSHHSHASSMVRAFPWCVFLSWLCDLGMADAHRGSASWALHSSTAVAPKGKWKRLLLSN